MAPQDSSSVSSCGSYDLVEGSGDQLRLRTSRFHPMVLAFIDYCYLCLLLHGDWKHGELPDFVTLPAFIR